MKKCFEDLSSRGKCFAYWSLRVTNNDLAQCENNSSEILTHKSRWICKVNQCCKISSFTENSSIKQHPLIRQFHFKNYYNTWNQHEKLDSRDFEIFKVWKNFWKQCAYLFCTLQFGPEITSDCQRNSTPNVRDKNRWMHCINYFTWHLNYLVTKQWKKVSNASKLSWHDT